MRLVLNAFRLNIDAENVRCHVRSAFCQRLPRLEPATRNLDPTVCAVVHPAFRQ